MRVPSRIGVYFAVFNSNLAGPLRRDADQPSIEHFLNLDFESSVMSKRPRSCIGPMWEPDSVVIETAVVFV
jgi:hypothetical protein